jgi:hypothetical protein
LDIQAHFCCKKGIFIPVVKEIFLFNRRRRSLGLDLKIDFPRVTWGGEKIFLNVKTPKTIRNHPMPLTIRFDMLGTTSILFTQIHCKEDGCAEQGDASVVYGVLEPEIWTVLEFVPGGEMDSLYC